MLGHLHRGMWRALTAVLAILAFGTPQSVTAYTIYLPRVHEAITEAARQCFEAARRQGAAPADCRTSRSDVARLSKLQWSLTNEQREVRWPDDPRREIKSFGVGRSGLNGKLGRCGKKIEKRGRRLHRIALFCASHYGDLQFLHAMKSTAAEDVADTREKILAWARFTYEVASEQVKDNEAYCNQFGGSKAAIGAAMVPVEFPYCGTTERAWTVGEFFSFRCGSLFLWKSCAVLGGEGLVKTTATGALLHMVQDSYSQSHARRASPVPREADGSLKALVSCAKPIGYEVYDEVSMRGHAAADEVPQWNSDCDDERRSADDVITASAMVMYHLDRRSPTEEIVEYLERRVF